MSNSETPTTGKTPTHIAYQVRESGKQNYWTRICAAWAHKDGKGFNIQLESIPLSGAVTLRVVTEEK